MDGSFYRRQMLCDWHMPQHLPELKIDYDDHFRNLKKAGAQSIVFDTKNPYGNCMYPSKVGFPHRMMKGDILAEMVARAKQAGIQFISYYNVVLSDELKERHPEWLQVDRNGETCTAFSAKASCLSNDDFAEHVGQHMEEIAGNYEIDGFFLDLQYFMPEGCFCSACKRKFQEAYGYELDADKFTALSQWRDLMEFQVEIRKNFIVSLKQRCEPVRPGLVWTWNGSGGLHRFNPELDEHADSMSTESHPPGYLTADMRARYAHASGKPFALYCPESQGSWGDWTLTTADTLKGLAAIALAHGGTLNINHVPFPCGDYAGIVPPGVWETVAETFRWVTEREPFCGVKKTVPVAGVLVSPRNVKLGLARARLTGVSRYGSDAMKYPEWAGQLLGESHIPYGLFYDESMERLDEYEVVLLPNQYHVSEELGGKLREYVQNGGQLVASYKTSLMDQDGNWLDNFSLADLFGTDLVRPSEYSVSYMDRFDGARFSSVPDMPILLNTYTWPNDPKMPALYCRLREEARAIAYLAEPVIESDRSKGYTVYGAYAPVATCTEYPSVIVNQYGKGKVIFLPTPFFKSFARKNCPLIKEVFRTLIVDELGISRKIRVSAPVSVKAVLMQDEEGWLLHLIHVQRETDSMYLTMFERKEPIHVEVAPDWTVGAVRQCLTGEDIRFSTRDGRTEFTIESITDHHILRILKE